MPILVTTVLAGALFAAGPAFRPGTTYDLAVRSLRDVVGHEAGEEISSPDQIAAYLKALSAQPRGDGHVIAFAEDPNFRGFTEATELLFLNAVLLGPAH